MFKNKKGFTLVELLSTIAILAIVLGIVSAAYVGITKHLKASFYKTLEESILVSGGEYYAYTSDRPVMFGDEKRVSLKDLVENKYLTDIVDRKGNQCDLNDSYIGAYKDSYDKTNYYVCLTCSGDDYEPDKTECLGNIGYSLQATATINDTNKVYQPNTWVNQYVKLTFKTLNDVEMVYIKDRTTGTSFDCRMEGTGTKTCSINVDKSGNYEYYGISNSNQETNHGYINIKVDTTNPRFDVYEDTTLITSNSITKNITSNSININNIVKNIVDSDSKVQSIRYSFEKQGSSKNYVTIDNNLTEFNINKNLGLGKYELIIEIKDCAGNIGSRTITYQINKNITKPDSSYCNDLTYNGYEQTLTKTPGEGYIFSDNKGTNAGEYTVKATSKNNYAWGDGTTGEKIFKCTISKKTLTPTVTVSNRRYNGQTTATGTVTLSGAVLGQTPTATETCQFNDPNVGTGKAVSCTITLGSSWTTNYQLSTTSASKTANITAKDLTITASNQEVSYGTAITTGISKITASGLISGHSVTAITLTPSTTNATTSGVITPSAATIKSGSTVVTSNYSITYNNGTLKINKINATCPTTSNYSGTYDGSSHTISVSGGSGGTIQYSTDNSNWSTTNPSRTNAGSQTTYVRVLGDTNHNTVTCTPRTITINRAKTATTGSCISNLTYNGSAQTLASGAVNATYSNNSRTEAGSQTVTVTANSNYAFSDGTTSKTLTCTIAAQGPKVKVVAYKRNSNGNRTGDSIAAITTSVSSNLIVTNNSSWLNNANYPYGVYFKITVTENGAAVASDGYSWQWNKAGTTIANSNNWPSGNVDTDITSSNLDQFLNSDGARRAKFTATDVNGNKTTVTIYVNIDKVTTCSVTKSNTGTTTGVTATFNCSGDVSGVSSCTSQKTGLKADSSYAITDVAGNTGYCSVSVTSSQTCKTRYTASTATACSHCSTWGSGSSTTTTAGSGATSGTKCFAASGYYVKEKSEVSNSTMKVTTYKCSTFACRTYNAATYS